MSGVGGAVPRQRLVNIQLLRGLAALLVVIAHAIDMSQSVAGDWGVRGFLHVENFGAFGVDIFFVISGFVMAYSVAGRAGGGDARRFLVRRWIRIAPPYLVVGLLMIPLNLAHGVPVPPQSVANLVLFVPFADVRAFSPPPLDVGWTLSFEFTFYLFVALAVTTGLARRIWLLAPALAALVLIGALVPAKPFLLTWFTNPMYLEFALGVLAHQLWVRGALRRLRPLWVGLAVLAVVVLTCEIVVGYPPVSEAPAILSGRLSAQRVLLWGLPAAAVFTAAVALREPLESAREHAFRRLGDVSYSLYLVHVPALLVLGAVLKQVEGFPGAVALLLGVAVALIAGLAFHRIVEAPLTKALDDRYRRRLREDRRSAAGT